jgi:hypothetical protein
MGKIPLVWSEEHVYTFDGTRSKHLKTNACLNSHLNGFEFLRQNFRGLRTPGRFYPREKKKTKKLLFCEESHLIKVTGRVNK